MSTSAPAVPTTEIAVRALSPCVSSSVTPMITNDPTTATRSGSDPSRIAGIMNCVNTTAVIASAPSAATPRQRDSAITADMNRTASSSSGRPRSWSTYL